MKNKIFKITVFILLLMRSLCSCDNNQQPQNGNVDLKNLKLSLCNDELKSKAVENRSDEYIKYSAINNKTLKIEQGFLMNCCSEDIGTMINVDKNAITINIADEDAGCNCICPRIASYEIINLQENETYKFIFLRNGQEYHTCEISFTIHVNGEIRF